MNRLRLAFCKHRAAPRRMSLAITMIIVALAVTSYAGAAERDLAPQRLFDQANQAFLAAETPDQFTAVAAMFQAVADQGMVSSAVLFNLGNAWMRAGMPGRAIAAYVQAERLAPRDPIVESNLQMARAAAGTVAPRRSWTSRVLFWQSWVSTGEKALAVTVLLGLAVLLGLVGQLRPGKFLTRTAAIVFGVTLLIGISLALDLHEQRAETHGVVARPDVIARKGAAESYAEAFTEPLLEGTQFRVRAREGDWVLLELDDGLDGWVPAEDVAIW